MLCGVLLLVGLLSGLESRGVLSQLAGAADASGVVFHNVGATGQYNKVVTMGCSGDSTATCDKSPFQVSGPLAPFHEDLTLVLRGPMIVENIAVFEQLDRQTQSVPAWQKVSSFSKSHMQSDNMAFLNNHGGDPAKSGQFNFCHGMSQSFAACDGRDAASSNQVFNGVLDDNVEINVMSSTSCDARDANGDSVCGSGYSWGVAYSGWRGNSKGHKLFAIQAQMPHAAAGAHDLPAIWLLNGQIVRSAQYGCNCRGMGKDGGCGEIDVAEVLEANREVLSSSLYSFQNSLSSLNYAARPVDASALFLAILDEDTSNGVIQVLKLPSSAAALNATSNLFDAAFLSSYQVHSMQSFANQQAIQFTL